MPFRYDVAFNLRQLMSTKPALNSVPCFTMRLEVVLQASHLQLKAYFYRFLRIVAITFVLPYLV